MLLVTDSQQTRVCTVACLSLFSCSLSSLLCDNCNCKKLLAAVHHIRALWECFQKVPYNASHSPLMTRLNFLTCVYAREPASVSVCDCKLQAAPGSLLTKRYRHVILSVLLINKLLQPGRHHRCFVCLVIDAVERQLVETHQIPVDTSGSFTL